ncbi:hypothetical protein VTN49DRAFT_6835 [Thermomyces lanuginosus]|uniref:uncharacterized protein n=1 Tax=Thermomyces lanuginosus TaxID=5541 RepID=UPI00374457C0
MVLTKPAHRHTRICFLGHVGPPSRGRPAVRYVQYLALGRLSALILAGDIGPLANYERFCDFLRSVYQKIARVYLVLGNHKFYGISRQEGLGLADKLQQEPGLRGRLVVMSQKRVDLVGDTLLGCTLHSHIPPEAEDIVRSKANDFRRIAEWTVADHTAEHA